MRRRKTVSYAVYGYLFSLPFIIAFLLFSLYPIYYTVYVSMSNSRGAIGKTFDLLKNDDNSLNIFGNYLSVIKNTTFWRSLWNTVIIWTINFIPQIFFALLLAAWFTSARLEIKGQGAFKVLFYMPNIITAATIAILFSTLFSYPTGVVNDLLIKFGLVAKGEELNFLSMTPVSRNIIAFIQFWMWYGYTMLIIISGILGLNPELFEAAEIDGASEWEQFFQVTLPNLRTIMVFTLVTSLIGGLQMFDIPKLFNNGNPDNTTLTTSLFIFKNAFEGPMRRNEAAAASLYLFLIIAMLSVIVFHLTRDKQELKEKAEIKVAKAKARALRRAKR